MEIKLLDKGYKLNENIYSDFINGHIDSHKEYFTNQLLFSRYAN